MKRAMDLLTNPLKMNGDAQNDQMARHNLASQLIKPVQRIMRYHLLFKVCRFCCEKS